MWYCRESPIYMSVAGQLGKLMSRISRILILGADYAGLLAALNLKIKVPELRVEVLRAPIADDFRPPGFATRIEFPTYLHEELGVPPLEFIRGAQPIWRIGTRYQWGSRAFFDHTTEFQVDTRYAALSHETGYYIGDGPNEFEAIGAASAKISAGKVFVRDKEGRPQIARNRYGYHLEHQRLKEFLEAATRRMEILFRDGRVVEVVRGEMGVASVRLEDGQTLTADLYIDASGPESLLLGQALGVPYCSFAASLPCDRAIVGMCPRSNEPIKPNTAVKARDCGWCWSTEHESFISCGHAFSSAHTSADQAEKELREEYPKVNSTRLLKVKQGRYERCWEKNVLGIGSAAGLVEPLAAAGAGLLAFGCQWLAQSLVDCDGVIRPTIIRQFNRRWSKLIEGEREFLGLFYKYNTRSDAPFWRDARRSAHVGSLEGLIRFYQDVGPHPVHRNLLLAEDDPIGLDGYYSVLLGQNLPHKAWAPPPAEMQSWKNIQESWRRKVELGFSVQEALNYFASAAAVAKAGAMA